MVHLVILHEFSIWLCFHRAGFVWNPFWANYFCSHFHRFIENCDNAHFSSALADLLFIFSTNPSLNFSMAPFQVPMDNIIFFSLIFNLKYFCIPMVPLVNWIGEFLSYRAKCLNFEISILPNTYLLLNYECIQWYIKFILHFLVYYLLPSCFIISLCLILNFNQTNI